MADSPVSKWKPAGGKVVGYLCSHVPEEVLYAAGILPVRLRAPGCASTPSADVYMSHLNCTYVKSCLEYVYTGKLDFLDGFVCTDGCDHTRRLHDVLKETRDIPFLHLLSVPRKVGGAGTRRWHRDEFARFKQGVEEAFGVNIENAALGNAIDVYNETRSLLRELYALRKAKNPPLTGVETLDAVVAGYAIPKDRYNRLLGNLLGELRKGEGVTDYRARLMIAGSGGFDDPAYLKVIEDLGGLVVADSLCNGSRYYSNPVGKGEDLLLELAGAYLGRPSCANMTDRIAQRTGYIIELVEEFGVDGVIFQRMRYCDLWGGQLLHLKKALGEAGIPLLSLEREYALDNVGQLETRVQAFVESIGG